MITLIVIIIVLSLISRPRPFYGPRFYGPMHHHRHHMGPPPMRGPRPMGGRMHHGPRF